MGRGFRRIGLPIAIGVCALLGAVPAANAGTFPGANHTMIQPIIVGQQDQAGTLTLSNNSTPPDLGPMLFNTIKLTPSCPQNISPTCTPTPDPGVFAIDSLATGRAGTACDGITFTVTIDHAPSGRYLFTPDAPVIVAVGGPTCIIDFTYDVLKVPTIDSNPGQLGAQTYVNASVNGTDQGTMGGGNGGQGTERTVLAANSPTIAIAADPTGIAGAQIQAPATLTGGVNPGGTITFEIWRDDPTCTGTPDFTDVDSVVSAAATGQFIPAATGTYYWVATYSGDPNNNAVATACNALNSTTVVSKGTPAISIVADPNGFLGSPIDATATLIGGSSPTGTVSFDVWGPDKPSCDGAPDLTVTPTVDAGAATGSVTPALPGLYRWIATYSGDSSNNPVLTGCNDAGSLTSVTLPPVIPPVIPPSSTPTPTTAPTATVTTTAVKKCKKGRKLRRGKCVRKKRKK